MRIFLLLVISVSACCALYSCKKHDDADIDYGQGTGRCRLIGVSSKQSGVNPRSFSLQYNDAGQLIQFRDSPAVYFMPTTFSYGPNTIVAVHRSVNGTESRRDSIVLNSDNLILSRFILSDSVVVIRFDFYYNSDKQVTRIHTSGISRNPADEFLTWQNGDMVRDSDAYGFVMNYSYYSDKKAQIGDALQIGDYTTFGSVYFKNAHLLKQTIYPSGDVYTNHYSLDNDGKIASVMFLGPSGDTATNQYFYECR